MGSSKVSEIRPPEPIPRHMGGSLILGRGGYQEEVHVIFKQFNMKPRIRFVGDHIDTALGMVKEGLGSIVTTKGAILSLPKEVKSLVLMWTETRTIMTIRFSHNSSEFSLAEDLFYQYIFYFYIILLFISW